MRASILASFIVAFAFASPSFAQIIYLPIQYQYGTHSKIYYGGSDPRVIAHANECRAEISGEPERVYSDCIPGQNARLFGFTANDARNEAYQNAPRYFRKADLALMAEPTTGGWIVPAQAGETSDDGRYYRASRRVVALPNVPSSTPRPLMIIPKKAFERDVPATKVASSEK